LWSEEEIDNTFPDLNRWDDMLKDLLPKTHSRRKEEPVRHEPVVDLKSVRPKPKPPGAEVRSPEREKARIAPVSDKHLLMLIQKYKDADKICEITQMMLQTIQRKVAHLSYLLKRYIDVEGFYGDTRPVKMTQEEILIPKGHLVDTGFKVGDYITSVSRTISSSLPVIGSSRVPYVSGCRLLVSKRWLLELSAYRSLLFHSMLMPEMGLFRSFCRIRPAMKRR